MASHVARPANYALAFAFLIMFLSIVGKINE
jgi:hypothetical protein